MMIMIKGVCLDVMKLVAKERDRDLQFEVTCCLRSKTIDAALEVFFVFQALTCFSRGLFKNLFPCFQSKFSLNLFGIKCGLIPDLISIFYLLRIPVYIR